jgi:hypothetical protein
MRIDWTWPWRVILNAEVKTSHGREWQTLDLDKILGNDGGRFVWGSSGIEWAINDHHLEYNQSTSTLKAEL